MWKLTIEDDQANKTVVHLVREEYGIGRSEENAIRLTERNISRRHLRLERLSDRWVLNELSSYNGCYVNGQRVAAVHDLAHGDVIQLGDYRLVVENEALLAGSESTATVPAIPRGGGSNCDKLVVLAGPEFGSEFTLTQERTLIGRGEDCQISLNHPSVSRVHAELHPLGEGRYEIFDKESANGVRVNGVELPRSFVEAHDVIELGDIILKLIPAGEIYIPGADESLQIAAIGAARRREAQDGQLGRLNGLGLKLGIALGVAAIAIVVALVATRGQSRTLQLEKARNDTAEHARGVLSNAKKLLSQGDARAAYKKAAELPAGSSARQSSVFREVQAAYADHLFELAEQTQDPPEKRTLLDEIARATGVDSGRRNRAVAALTALTSKAVDVNELPKARLGTDDETTQSEEASSKPGLPRPTAHTEKNPGTSGRAATLPKPRAPAKNGSVTLVRKNPFGASTR